MDVTLKCPYCGNHVQEQFTRKDGDSQISCGVCSRTADAAEFFDAVTRKRILEAAAKIAIDKLKHVPGFKPRR